jgi:hypothetical protein
MVVDGWDARDASKRSGRGTYIKGHGEGLRAETRNSRTGMDRLDGEDGASGIWGALSCVCIMVIV